MNDEKNFTQEDVNRIIKERLAQEKAKSEGEIERRIAEAVKAAENRAIAAENKLLHQMLTFELTQNHAVDPEEIGKLLVGGMKFNEAGEVVYTDKEGNKKLMSAAVKEYLASNAWAVKKEEPFIITGVTPGSGLSPDYSGDEGMRAAFDLK